MRGLIPEESLQEVCHLPQQLIRVQVSREAQRFLQSDTVDAIFCDINMPDLNGMDFIKSLAVPPLVVFTTAYAEYAVEGFKVNAVDYLLKPFGLQDFMRAANRLQERLVPPPSLTSLTSPLSPLTNLSPLTTHHSPLKTTTSFSSRPTIASSKSPFPTSVMSKP